MDQVEWEGLIAKAMESWASPVRAQTFVRNWSTSSNPVLLACDDGREYVVKGAQAGRMIVTDQVVGRLGTAMGAPVAEVGLVDVPRELINSEPQMSHMVAGESHGSVWISGCTDSQGMTYSDQAENRSRFATLSVLFGWVVASDHQFVYKSSAPNLVYSVDHGHFFPGANGWDMNSLAGAPPPEPDQQLRAGCSLTEDELREAQKLLLNVSDSAIAQAVASPPDGWGISMQERVALAAFLAKRRDEFAQKSAAA